MPDDHRLRFVVFRADGSIFSAHKHGDHTTPCQCEEPVEPGGKVVIIAGLSWDAQEREQWRAFTRHASITDRAWTPESLAGVFPCESTLEVPDVGPVPEGHERRFMAGLRCLVDSPTRELVEHDTLQRMLGRAPRGLGRPMKTLVHIFPGSPLLADLIGTGETP